ncbi:disulfide oxidoreductase [Paenibacillus thermoaerophilus]|uniref:Disulfide oxidoreductase n=1 Tax=Paenibacillus thermoaerophilus TaxID=1215385 RepID=A0ABW2V569_9BACL|nr:disulfide oxidoreductase [Paenibacillus thermoaerophilus]TMV17924.1 disulfide bond formation protein B [Paenibacillus thermoaerophilus]
MLSRKTIEENALYWAFLVALVATMGSLYFSEVRHYIPCSLCWYQRIFMYPLTILFGVAAVRKDRGVIYYGFPLAAIGGSISLYHVLLQKLDWMKSNMPACGLIPCDTDYINWFGFVTIPVLALTAFILILIILAVYTRVTRA